MSMTRRLQGFVKENLTLEDALPTQMPVYVNSIAYLFGVSTLSSLALIVLTGIIMSIFGPGWYHLSRTGRFFNTMHFWSTQVFFLSMVLHLVTKFLKGAWRDGRWSAWLVGVLTLAVAIFSGLTGFLAQSNFDSQWIAGQSKDAMNAMGIGGFFVTTNFAQVITLHVAVMPLLIVVLVGVHVVLVRSHSPVRPYPEKGDAEYASKKGGRR
jgi:quinol-cytochrome oxidoreductase complex cytochrome b subunit